MLLGSLLKTPLFELRSISGGFGIGSEITLPEMADVGQFPLLLHQEPSAKEALKSLRSGIGVVSAAGSGGEGKGKPYIAPAKGHAWFAAGMLGTACGIVDISAVLYL